MRNVDPTSTSCNLKTVDKGCGLRMELQNEAPILGGVLAAAKTGAALRESRVSVQTTLFIALSGVAAGSVITACGVGKLLIYNGHLDHVEMNQVFEHHRTVAYWLLAIGMGVALPSCALTLWLLQQLGEARDDCTRYGRHIFGLTFAMLVVGLCNAVVASTLAIGGDLTFSATEVLEASDPKHAKDADQRSLDAEMGEINLERAVKLAELELSVAARAVRACAAQAAADCKTQREAELNIGDELARKRMELADAHDALWRGKHECELTRGRSRRALFFLLTMSTMTAVLGASFYVVNCVRRKRPLLVEGANPDEVELDERSEEPTSTRESRASMPAGDAAGPLTPSGPVSKAAPAIRRECFDVHEFWSGAFFRFGEAVLFTFAFFWLIWTSENNERVIWLPVLALFVGMFVKAGEVVVFSLGKRILLAVDALLPGGASTPPAPSPRAAEVVKAA